MFEVNKNDSTPMDFDLSRFGQLDTDAVVMSPFGLAVKYTSKDGKTSYCSWNRDKNRIDDVNGMVFPLEGMIFRVPCTELEVGDIIEYEGDYVFVSEVEDNGNYELLTGGGARGSHIKTTSVMGFDFYAKIVTPMKNLDSAEGGIIGIMGIMKMQMTMKMMSGGDKGQGGGMMGGGVDPSQAGAAMTPQDLTAQAEEIAAQLLAIPSDKDRRTELVNIKHSNPTLHAQVKQMMTDMRGQAASQGQQMILQQQQQGM